MLKHPNTTLISHHPIFINTHQQIAHQFAVMNHCLQEYFTGKWTWQKDKNDATWREMEEKGEKKNEKRVRKEKPTKEHARVFHRQMDMAERQERCNMERDGR